MMLSMLDVTLNAFSARKELESHGIKEIHQLKSLADD